MRRARNRREVRFAESELEVMAMHTENPALRERCILEMQAPYHPFFGKRLVVLNKVYRQTQFGKYLLIIRFEEHSTVVTEDPWKYFN